MDTGMINALGFSFSNNIGKLVENIVAVELLRQKSGSSSHPGIFYWKDNQHREVDFEIRKGTVVSQLIQVCYNINDPKTRERELKSLIRAKGEMRCSDLLVITWDRGSVEEYKGNSIRFVPLWKWLQG